MKKILSIILVLVLVTASTTLPAAAEEKMDVSQGKIVIGMSIKNNIDDLKEKNSI